MKNIGKKSSLSSIGIVQTETASIAYTGELLPAGTASYGNELVVNGEFDNGLTSWIISNTDATHTVTAENGGVRFIADTTTVITALKQNIGTINITKTYLLSITISDYVSGSLKFDINGSVIILPTTIGTYTYFYNPTADGFITFYRNSSNVNIKLDNVSVKEVLINPNLRYLKNSGKDKTPALVGSGQGKFFNGTNQYINTGIIPNASQGTLVTRFTYVSGMVSRCIIGTSEISIWVNASGKIEGLFGNVVITSTDVLVSGRSYHVELPYLGNNASIKVDNVNKAGGTASSFTPTLPIYIGARNNNGTADRFFNNVIDETYYYDVALTDAQIESLYKYPEKVKEYNGGIVPDIGNEANCKLFLPMCESSTDSKFSFAINIADAQSNELVLNGNFDTDTTWNHSTNPTISGGTANWNGQASLSQPFTPIPGAYYLLSFTITSYTSGSVYGGFLGGVASFSNGFSAIGTYYAIIKGNVDTTQLYFGTAASTVLSIDNVSLKKITAYPIVNWSSSMVTSAKQLSYGMQCIGMKRDANGIVNGVLIGGMSFDGGVSTKGVSTGITLPNTSTWAIEIIIYVNGISSAGYLKALYGGSGNFLQIQRTNATTNQIDISCMTKVFSATLSTGWHHIAVDAIGKFYIDGILVSTQTPLFTGVPTVVTVGSDSGFNASWKTGIGTPKIHKGAEYAKFNIAKAWAKAQKTIAKLGA